ncbi:MAG: type II secretion system ATPase GspE [Phycisphaerae bacterium]|nr:type II secretion system ATPase GspE [Phycisphaerae bacterium]
MSIGELLIERGIITAEQLSEAEAVQRRQGSRLDRVLLEMGYVDETTLLRALGEQLSIPFVDLSAEQIDMAVLRSMPAKLVHRRGLLPLSKTNGTLRIATSDPFDVYALDELRMLMGCHIEPVLASRAEIDKIIKAHFGVGGETIETLIDDQTASADDGLEVLTQIGDEDKNLIEEAQEASVVRLVNEIMVEAINQRASDIHVEPYEGELQVRYRVDGVLHQANVPPQIQRFQSAIISRIKIMAGLNIAEKRLPQDGRIKVRLTGREIDIRVSVIPMLFGEGVVMRILDKKSLLLDLRSLGMAEDTYALFERIITAPHGILLVTGPTGSGKTTTLYAALSEVVNEEIKVITVEDPVEYHLVGVNQIQVMPKVGLTFARGLRSILRHDPDVVMVGEIRDFETAESAVQAALTGHMVYSTLHTNDAPSATTRLLDMGVEPFLVTSTLQGVLAQRLVRRICLECKEAYTPDSLPDDCPPPPNGIIYRGKGCKACRNTGYRGRLGVYELFALSDPIRELILQRKSSGIIAQQAIKEGMVTIRRDGWRKVLAGQTTPEEVARVSQSVG